MANDVAPAGAFSSIGSNLGNGLTDLLMAGEIQPGEQPSYQLCKILYTLHPIGKKMVDAPIKKAQSQQRVISVPDSPEDAVREQFERVWKEMNCDRLIANTFRLGRIYGLASVVAMPKDAKPGEPIDYENLWKSAAELRFNCLDPLNTAGSLVLNQDPNSSDFLKVRSIAVSGVPYNLSRAVVVMNEDPIYIDYTSASFGFVGRSVYQRALLPLKSFVQSMITDDLVTIKAGVLIAKIKQPGSIATALSAVSQVFKRAFVKEAKVGGVISISASDNEAIESLDLTNIPAALEGARKNILENIAVSADMPAQLLNSETFAQGFDDGEEDAKAVVEYIDSIRQDMQPLYDYFTKIVQYVAWNPEFYKTIQSRFPEDWGKVDFNVAFYRWRNSFAATWPSLLREPESELIKKEAVKLEALISQTQLLLQIFDPDNKVALVEYMVDNFNALKMLFPNPLVIDPVALLEFLNKQYDQQQEQHEKQMSELAGPSPNRKFGDEQILADRGMLLREKILQLPAPRKLRGKGRERAAAAH